MRAPFPARRQTGTVLASEPRPRGVTIVELMVVVAVITVVMGLALSVYRHGVRLGRQTACLGNLRQLALALNSYYTECRQLPADDRPERFDGALLPFVKDRAAFHCPMDPREGASSYAPYYVQRRELKARDFLLGCPRHASGRVATILFGSAGAEGNHLGRITHDGEEVQVGERVAGGVLRFADGSVAAMKDDLAVDIVTSFERADGSYYTILRVPLGEPGAIALRVNPTSRLEVITPAAVAGSQGTTFYLIAYDTGEASQASLVYVTDGQVRTTSRGRRPTARTLSPGEAVLVETPSGDIEDCRPPTKKKLPKLPAVAHPPTGP